jgi:peptide/nickel transport system substrate-binding protein
MDPKWRNCIILAIVVIIVVAAFTVRVVTQRCLQETNPLIIDQAEIPDSLDPGETFSTPGWAAVQQVYQGLVNYNQSSSTQFAPVLAANWNESNGGLTWVFNLRPGVTFSNGDPYNAYVQWFSFYRSLLLASGPQFILEQNFYSTNFNASNPLNYYSNITNDTNANNTLVNDLNSWNFDDPNATEIALMEVANQSFQVLNASAIELNVGYGYLDGPPWSPLPYTYLLASISAPNSYAVDPNVVQANGGVVIGQPNTYLATNMIGTGQYLLSYYNGLPGGGYTLTPNSHYWGSDGAAAAEPWNNMIQPANTTIDIIFQDSVDITTNNLKVGDAASASFAYIGPGTIHVLQGDSCLIVQALPEIYGSTSGSWWIYMNQNVFPFNNLSVRAAVAHAINYQQIIQEAFGGYADQWVGPVPPQYPYYNPQNLTPYQYNLTLAQQEIADSPCANGACSGTSITYEYLDTGIDWAETAAFLENDLAQIGLNINPVPISLQDLYDEQVTVNGVCVSTTTTNGGPFYMGQEFYTSDYVSPDDWTQNDALNVGSANLCMSEYNNITVNNLVYSAASTANATNLTMDYTNITSAMYDNYTDVWLVVPTSFAVYSNQLQGVIENPMASAEPFSFLFNTQWAK